MRGRPVLGFFSGLFLGVFIWIDLWLGGSIASDNGLLLPLAVIGAVGGVALALWAPFGRKRLAPAMAAAPAPAESTPLEAAEPSAMPPPPAAPDEDGDAE